MSPTTWHRAHVSSDEPLHRKLVFVLVAPSCLTLCDPWAVACQAPCSWNSSGKNTEWVACSSPGQETGDKINTLTSLLCTPPLKLMPESDRWGQAACLQPCQISLFLCPLSFSSLASFLSSLYHHHHHWGCKKCAWYFERLYECLLIYHPFSLYRHLNKRQYKTLFTHLGSALLTLDKGAGLWQLCCRKVLRWYEAVKASLLKLFE